MALISRRKLDGGMDMKMKLLALLAGVVLLGGCQSGEAGTGNRQSVDFPAYEEGRTEYNGAIYDTPTFTASMDLPEGWEFLPPAADERDGNGSFFTPVDIYRAERYIGTIGFNLYTPAEDVPQEEYYKVVYAQLRLGSLYFWSDYQAVNATDSGETGTATVNYKSADEGESAAEVPYTEVPGVVGYNKDLCVYVGIQFAPDAVTPDQARAIASSLTIEPKH